MSVSRTVSCATIAVVLLALLAPGAVAASDDLEPFSGPADVVVTIDGSGVSPRMVTVQPGDVVEWRNRDDERHRVRSRSGPAEFDSGNLERGESIRFRFTGSGSYAYVDARDEDATAWHGRVVVDGGGGGESSSGGGGASSGGGGASSGGGGTSTGPASAGATIRIGDDFFSPSSVRVAAGSTVTFRNEGEDEHSATSSDGGPIDSGALGGGDTYRATFPYAGTFAFLCIFHSDMQGTVTVVADPGSAPAPTSVPEPTAVPAPPTAGSAAPLDASVEAADLEFRPPTVRVAVGGNVAWTNVGQAPHTVTASDGTFDSGLLARGATFELAFPSAGTYAYLCSLHPGMAGTVEVVAAVASPSAGVDTAPAPSPDPSLEAAALPASEAEPTDAPVPATASVSFPAPGPDPTELAGVLVALLAVSVAVLLFARVLRGTVRPGAADLEG